MLRGKKARYECGYGCCKTPRSYRARDKRAWKREARNG